MQLFLWKFTWFKSHFIVQYLPVLHWFNVGTKVVYKKEKLYIQKLYILHVDFEQLTNIKWKWQKIFFPHFYADMTIQDIRDYEQRMHAETNEKVLRWHRCCIFGQYLDELVQFFLFFIIYKSHLICFKVWHQGSQNSIFVTQR